MMSLRQFGQIWLIEAIRTIILRSCAINWAYPGTAPGSAGVSPALRVPNRQNTEHIFAQSENRGSARMYPN